MKPRLAKDLMTTKVTTVRESASIGEMISILQKKHFSGVPVVRDKGQATGLVSQNDVLRALALLQVTDELPDNFHEKKKKVGHRLSEAKNLKKLRLEDFLSRPVSDIMTPFLASCKKKTPIAKICKTMAEKHIHRIVVLDKNEKVVGIISSIDLISHFSKEQEG